MIPSEITGISEQRMEQKKFFRNIAAKCISVNLFFAFYVAYHNLEQGIAEYKSFF